jgi:hypothetical protein
MDLSDPTRAVTPTLDGPVLAVLAAAGRPLTVGDIAGQAARGSEIGVRRSISRLVEQGIVQATLVGRNRVHELNRDHIAAGAADLLAGLRLELWRRLRAELGTWDPSALYAAVFGSAARGDGDVSSDIDLLIVHPPFSGERLPGERLAGERQNPGVARPVDAAPELWYAQVDRLRDLVERWTGNPLQVVDLSFREWWEPAEDQLTLLTQVQNEGIVVARSAKLPPTLASGKSVG